MCGKNKVCFGILKRKSKFSKFCLCPLSCRNDLITALLKICLIFHRCHSCSNGSSIHCVRIKRILHIIQILDQLRISECISNTHSCKRSGLGECLHNKKIIIFFNQRKCGYRAKIHISLIYDHDTFRIFCHDLLNLRKRHLYTCRCIGIREYDSAILTQVVFLADMELLIQCRTLIRNAEKICPYIIK